MQRAFTLVELVIVMVLIGILAAVAIPRFADRNAFDAAGFANELTAALKHARKSAVAMRRNVCVGLGANTLTFTRNLAADVAGFGCGANAPTLPLPGGADNVLLAPSGVTIAYDPNSVASIAFNGLGQPSSAVTVTVTGNDGTSARVMVEAGSGYVHVQ